MLIYVSVRTTCESIPGHACESIIHNSNSNMWSDLEWNHSCPENEYNILIIMASFSFRLHARGQFC